MLWSLMTELKWKLPSKKWLMEYNGDHAMDRTEVLKILKKYKIENTEKYGINNLGIFGSLSRDEGEDESDIDIVIETLEPDLFKIIHIKEELEGLFHRSVDIVRKREKMNPYLKKRIERDAVYV